MVLQTLKKARKKDCSNVSTRMLKEQLHTWINIDIVLRLYCQKNQIAIDYNRDYTDTAFSENTS